MTTRTETIPLVDDTELAVTVGEPEGAAVRGGIVVLHSAHGVTERTERIVEGLAGEGWLAVAPHLFHREGAARFDDATSVTEGASRVSGASVLADSDAAFGWLAEHGVPSDRMGVLGFDLGATAALVVASQRALGAAVTVAAAGVQAPLADGLPALLDVVGRADLPLARALRRDRGPGRPLRRRPAPRGRARLAAPSSTSSSSRPRSTASTPTRPRRSAQDPLEDHDGEGTRSEARNRVLNWFDAHLR